jgi:hypothetical protein
LTERPFLAGLLAESQDHEAAAEWFLTAAYVGPASRWARPAMLGAGHALAALKETNEALTIYRKLVPPRTGPARPDDREVGGVAALRAAEILRDAGATRMPSTCT